MTLPAVHETILREALRAPSAHNAQPWRLVPAADGGYELHYDHLDYLPHDPDDRDAYLAIGAFLETLDLAAQRYGHGVVLEPRYTRAGSDLFVGVLRLLHTSRVDPLAGPAAYRRTNRHPYHRSPLPNVLRTDLERLGCALVPPGRVARLVARASVLSWRDRRFVADLDRWTSGDPDAAAGMTPAGLPLTAVEWAALRLAFRAGRLPAPLALLYSSRDVRLLRRAPAVAVLGAPDLSPPALVDAGRRLLRCWVTITAAGYAYHPISIAVDRPETAPEVAAVAGIAVPVAVFRIGRPTRPAPESNRRPLAEVLDADGERDPGPPDRVERGQVGPLREPPAGERVGQRAVREQQRQPPDRDGDGRRPRVRPTQPEVGRMNGAGQQGDRDGHTDRDQAA